MKVSEQTGRRKLSETLRWVCVLPAAVLAGIVTRFIAVAIVLVARAGGRDTFGDSGMLYWLSVLLYYVPPKMIFVIAGAIMAPRFRRATATGLAVLGLLLSLMIHVVGQHLAGNRVGVVNYTHFIAESVGLLGGAAWIFAHEWRKRRTNSAA